MSPRSRSETIKAAAAGLGFERCGITRAEPIGRAAYLREWVTGARAGGMDYLGRLVDVREDPRRLLEGARSIIVVALSYHQRTAEEATAVRSGNGPALPGAAEAPAGRVAMYARGEDYHVVLKDKLFDLMRGLRAAWTEPFEFKVCVDTAPIVEREVAAAAGVGWIGKNTLVLHQDLGSYFFLGAVVTTLDLEPDAPAEDHCGSCTACLDACPTKAFAAPYQMDAERCISYLTIEHRGELSAAEGAMVGEWLFGCDVCQEVCPFNRHAPETLEPRFAPRMPARIPVVSVLQWGIDEYRSALRGTAVKRATLPMLQRNARFVAHNSGRVAEIGDSGEAGR